MIKHPKKIAILFTAVILSACSEKRPIADFSTDKNEYQVGETIKLENKSDDAYFYNWTMPDGQTDKNKNPSFTTNLAHNGVISFKLEVYSKKGRISDYKVKNVNVKQSTGELVFWDSKSFMTITNRYVMSDGKWVADIDIPNGPSAPECSNPQTKKVTLTSGPHLIQINHQGYSKIIDVIPGQCTVINMF